MKPVSHLKGVDWRVDAVFGSSKGLIADSQPEVCLKLQVYDKIKEKDVYHQFNVTKDQLTLLISGK